MESFFSYYSLPLPPLPPSQEEDQGSLNGDAAGPQQELQMQVPESDTTAEVDSSRTGISVGGAVLATTDAADVTKSGDVDTDDNESVVEIDDAGSHYQPSWDEDYADRKNNVVNLNEREAAVNRKSNMTHVLLPCNYN